MNRTATHFGSKATDARIAARVASDYTPEAWAADKASQRTHIGQEATVTTPSQQGVKCGNHKGSTTPVYHPTATDVRACYMGHSVAPTYRGTGVDSTDTFNEDWAAMKNEAAALEAQQEQAAYAAEASGWSRSTNRLQNSQRTASNGQPMGQRDDTPAVATVPAGRYAVTGEDGATKFYRVDRPTEGKWKGYTFVEVQAGDELHNLRGRAARDGVLRKIAEAGVQAAMERYGREIGACGHCGRTLTNEDSRERGIGPICAGKMGW